MKFSLEGFLSALNGLHVPASGYCIAYSGGLDSHVLLHGLAAVRQDLDVPVRAVHINHGLNPRAGAWQDHCRQVCQSLEIKLFCFDIDAAVPAGESPEAVARERRYRVLEEQIRDNEVLLTAHHADDQAETLLLQLLRGSGPAGLAAMPVIRKLGNGYHARPLLSFDRQSLHKYAVDKSLSWVDDDSNVDQRFDRNFIRYSVMPVLQQRWPSVAATLGRAAVIQAETKALLQQLADLDMRDSYDPQTGTLLINALREKPRERQSNLLRRWLHQRGFPTPDSRRLKAIIEEVIDARLDAEPCVSWEAVEVRRFRGRLYAMSPLPTITDHDRVVWDINESLKLPLGELSAEPVTGTGIKVGFCRENTVRVGFRQGGELIKWPDPKHHRELKKLFQEYEVPPWIRRHIPLLFINDELVSVAGVWTNVDYLAASSDQGLQVRWTESKNIFGVKFDDGSQN